MNTNKSFAYGISAVLIRHGWRCLSALAGVFAKQKLRGLKSAWMLILILTGCPEPDPVHTHTYSTEWSHNATQHWHECTAHDGAKTDIANHTGDPCAVCEYTAAVNQPPTANAGNDQTHTLANNLTITLNGTDSTGNITAYAWQCESYTANQGAVSAEYTPAQVNALITNANTATATVAPRKAGTYVFKLTVTDNDGESDTDTVTVAVEAITHTITVPAITTVSNPLNFGEVSALIGWNSDFASTDVTYMLTLDNVAQSAGTTSISPIGLSDASHTIIQTFYYKGNPIKDGSRSSNVLVAGNTFAMFMPNQSFSELPLLLSKTEIPPVAAHAQADPTHTLANNLTITLNGTDSAGNITAYTWQCESYTADQGTVSAEYTPAQVDALIANANTATATVTPRKAGTYVFRLTVTDNDGESDTDEVTVVVEGYVASANITIPTKTFTSGTTDLDFSVDYGNIDSVSADRIIYKISDGTTIWWSTDVDFDGRIHHKNQYNSVETTFTQTFYYDGVEIPEKNRSVTAVANGSQFMAFTGINASTDYLSATIPALSISLSETIKELP